MSATNANGHWRTFALKVAGALLFLGLGWLGNGLINDHQAIQDLQRRVAVLEAKR